MLDAEDYVRPPKKVVDRYSDKADHVDAWTFYDEFGYSGCYYQRGLQWGKTLKETWDVAVLQVYEARMYAGKPGCREGNCWWMKGIHDAGIEIWIATERTYGAAENELKYDFLPHLFYWFVDLREYVSSVHENYPFAARVLPGFHPWNSRLHRAHYLPKYLDEQLRLTRDCAPGCWLYAEGIPQGGDPRETLDREILESRGVTAEQYLDVLRKHPTWRRRE